MRFIRIYILLSTLLVASSSGSAQTTEKPNCTELLCDGYISDGQEYIAKLAENNVAKFYCTFYGGSYYRIIACSDIEKHPLIINVYDTDKNLLFSNKDYNYTNYWNFIFGSTIDCIVEVEFEAEEWLKREVKLLIGFKEK